MIRRNRNLLLLHLVANALLLWLAYEWLGVDESTAGKLLLSAVDALAIVTLVCWLYGATMVWFQSKEPKLNEAFRTAIRHIDGLLVLAIIALAIYGVLGKLAASADPIALRVASWLTWTFRKPVKPATINTISSVLVWICRWTILPVIFLPLASAIATRGRTGWRNVLKRRPLRHWLAVPLLALLGLWLPFVILNWKPAPASFTLELASFTARAIVAYLLFLSAVLTMVRLTGAGLAAYAEIQTNVSGR